MRRLAVGLVVLMVLLVGGDRVGDLVAEEISASSLQASQDLTQEPEVSIGGFPFLTQLVGRDFDEIEVVARDVPLREGEAGDLGLTMRRLEVTLRGVTASRDLTRLEVRRARASAVLGYDELGQLLGVDLAAGPDGRIRVTKQFDVFGQSVEPEITIRPQVVDGALAFSEPAVDGLSAGAEFVAEQLNEIFGTPIPLQGIPFDVSVEDVSAGQVGIRLELSGSDLTYVENG